MKSSRLLIVLLFFCCYSCKKNAAPAPVPVSIVGKWFIASEHSILYDNGVQTGTFADTKFTTDDYTQYFDDGTGVNSAAASPAPKLISFKYKLSGNNLTQYNSVVSAGIPETITKLTADSLSIHYVVMFINTDTFEPESESNDFSYSRAP